MKHCIIVKWNEIVTDKAKILDGVREVFADCTATDGVKGVEIIPNIIDRPNRYDVMIVVTMDKDALTAWDDSDTHKRWKSEYGDRIVSKAIFDAEEL